jgi:hypothetical protein
VKIIRREGHTAPLGLARNGAVRVIAPRTLEHRYVGNEAALILKINEPFKMQRKVYLWGEARRCTSYDSRARTATALLSNENEPHDRHWLFFMRRVCGVYASQLDDRLNALRKLSNAFC